MSDKSRRLYPVQVTFNPGELPSNTKLNGISTQARSGLTIVEQMLGDLWNQAGDPLLSPTGDITRYALHIPNLARSLGQMRLLNSMAPSISGFIYHDPVGSRYQNRNKAFLKYPVSSGTPVLSGDGGLYDGSPVGSPYGLILTGDWYLDQTKGIFYSFDPIPIGLFIAYQPILIGNTSPESGTPDATSWNVIPDPTTWSGAYSGLKISYVNNTDDTNGYHIWLPPRKPLDATRSVSKTVLPTTENTGTGNPDSGAIFYYQDITANAALTRGDNYRYNLPVEITGASAGDILPAGLLYIWDEQKGTIVEGVTFKCPADTSKKKWLLVASGLALATVFDTYITDNTTQAPANYTSRFKLIVASNSLARSLSVTNRRFYNHSHKNEEGDVPVDHGDLKHLVTPSYNATNNSNYPTNVPQFTPSQWAEDDHWMYLHRGGTTGGADARDLADNAMFNKFVVSRGDYTNQFMIDVLTSADYAYLSINGVDGAVSTTRIAIHHTTGDIGFEIAGNAKGSHLFAGQYKIVRNSTTEVGNNLKFRDSTGGSQNHSAMQYAAISFAGFQPITSNGVNGKLYAYNESSKGYIEGPPAASTCLWVANLDIPNGAQILGIQLVGSGPTTGNTALRILRQTFDGPLVTTTQVGTTITITNNNTLSIYSVGDLADETATVLTFGTIDKQYYAYSIELLIDGHSSGKGKFYSATVAYVMPELAW